MKIQSVTPQIIKQTPDQFSYILNRLIDEVNRRQKDDAELKAQLAALTKRVDELEPTPPEPQGDWVQVLAFNIANMGTTPGYCEQNVREGFGIPTGTYNSAYEDMLAQRNGGTLHEEIYPPSNISVPIYIRTGTPAQHVVVWDHGTVYSDGMLVNDFVSYYGASNIYGWGELCDGVRVVSPAS